MKPAKQVGRFSPWAGWSSFHTSQAKIVPSPPQRRLANASRSLMQARVPGQVSSRSRLAHGPPLAVL
jgi:hypothetical protein